MSKQRGLEKCARWLAYCLDVGWPKSALDDLETIWWAYHDEHGNFKDASQPAVEMDRAKAPDVRCGCTPTQYCKIHGGGEPIPPAA